MKNYAFGFVLSTTIGNMTRYLNFRKYAVRDESVEFTWAPTNHWVGPDAPAFVRRLPGPVAMRVWVLMQTMPVMRRLSRLDAVMVHLFEADTLLSLRRSVSSSKPLVFSSTDEAPILDRATYPLYPSEIGKPVWRQKLRLAIDLWRVRNTDYFVPFSKWVAGILTAGCKAPAERVAPIHVGLDLELWPAPDLSAPRTGVPKILFVGGDFKRKGGEMLLEVFNRRFASRAELHLVTKQAPERLPARVTAYRDFEPNDVRLRRLFADCDVVVVPTTADTGPLWVFLEGMACGLPVIGTDTGSNKEIVRDGENGVLIRVGDAAGLEAALERIVSDPALRLRMGAQGRRIVETDYSAAINVPRILAFMKEAVDRERSARRRP